MKKEYYYLIGGLLVGGIIGYAVAKNQYSRLKTGEKHSDFRGQWWWENWEDYKRRMLRYEKEHPE